MKLTKISLATLVALGAFSSVASATPLEEAIKNVDLSGFARYRYTTTKTEPAGASATTDAGHQFKSIFSFKAALDDNFFGVLSLRYNATDISGSSLNTTNTTSSFGVNEFYLGYTVGNTTVTAGKQVLGTYFTDDAIGTGIRVVNNDIKGLTLAAVAFDAIEDNTNEMDGELFNSYPSVFTNNLYGLAAIGSFDPVSFQLWYASLVDVADLIAADVAFNFDVSNDVNIGAQVQYAYSNVENTVPTHKDSKLYTAELGTELFGAKLSAGYIGWSVKDKDRGVASLEDQGSFISYGEQTFDYTDIDGKANYWFLTAGYAFDKFGLGAEYIRGNKKSDVIAVGTKTKYNEIIGRISYDYSSKLQFSSYYSYATSQDTGLSKEKGREFRFETKYSF